MTDRTLQNRIITKQHRLEYACTYGLTHFCDGKPNKSVDENATPKPRCPNYYYCDLRKHSIYDTEVHYD